MGVLPPINTYKMPWDVKYRFGPATQNLVMPGKEPRFMDIPSAGVAAALQALERIDIQAATYFSLSHPLLPPDRSQMGQAKAVQNFLLMWSRALQQMVSLAQAYMADAEFARVTGAPEGWLESNRNRLGVLAVELAFDVRELNEELTMKRIEAVNTAVLPTDVQGVVARNKWVEFQLRAINPAWAKELIMPASEASDGIHRQVRDDIAQMFLGNPAAMVENDPTAGAKLQFARQIVQQNPNYQQALANQESRFAQLMQVYVQNLTFSVTQEQNKQIGRIGVNPEAAAASGGATPSNPDAIAMPVLWGRAQEWRRSVAVTHRVGEGPSPLREMGVGVATCGRCHASGRRGARAAPGNGSWSGDVRSLSRIGTARGPRRSGKWDQSLQVHHIEPAPKLESDLLEMPDLREPVSLMKPDGSHILGVNHRQDGMQPPFLRRPDQRLQQERSPPTATPGFRDVDRVLTGKPVTDPIVKPVQRTPSHHFTRAGDRHPHRITIPFMGIEPFQPMPERPRLFIIGRRRAQDRVVVDGEDSRAVIAHSASDLDVAGQGWGEGLGHGGEHGT
jgi:hypothetical protein